MGSAAAYAAARACSPGPGDGNKQPNIGQSRTGHFNDSIQTAVAANDAAPVGPPTSIAAHQEAMYIKGMNIGHSHGDQRY
jgi:hypothetical protein